MSLKKKYLKVFALGFRGGVFSTDHGFNGDTWEEGSMKDGTDEVWERKFKEQLEAALKEFDEFQEKARL